ncbi:MAG: thiamine pyrophosphate-binding protein [Candidatus Tectomicrobia bacterium]|nr:thiamine pyrophosphate-binding protein [Candidatus Tectomicrobia bacterium]
MRRLRCMEMLARLVTDELVVTSVGGNMVEWHAQGDRPQNLYGVFMGGVTPMALGLALALPRRRVLAFDGDGSLLLNLGALCSVGELQPPNLKIIVFDNAAYDSPCGLPTVTAGRTDLAAAARACGIDDVATVRDVDAFASTLRAMFATAAPSLLVAKVEKGNEDVPVMTVDKTENKYRFVRHIEASEKLTILPPAY